MTRRKSSNYYRLYLILIGLTLLLLITFFKLLNQTPSTTSSPSLTIQQSLLVPKNVRLPKASPQASPDTGEIIIWSPTRKLTWTDFRAQPLKDVISRSEISTRIHPLWLPETHCQSLSTNQFTCTLKVVQLAIRAEMNPFLSWVIPEAADLELLEHEQLHFDLTEVYARKIRTATRPLLGLTETATGISIQKAQDSAFKKLEDRLNFIVIPLQDELNHEQTRYDQESQHSLNQKKQQEWKEFIRGQLK